MSKGYQNKRLAVILWTDGSENRVILTQDEFDEFYVDEAVYRIWWA